VALGGSLGIHLRHHGIVMTSPGVEEAVVNAIWL
jgi:ribulose-5-phosphate 4-epimerase/fuculose-1-phosphate aldolase